MGYRDNLMPASFRGAEFHVETGSKAGGRRIVNHEFPKRDIPYAEDMGRKSRKFPIVGYLIGDDFAQQRDALVRACEQGKPGMLQHPTMGMQLVVCDSYTVTERRERGRMCEIEMNFLEAGQSVFDQQQGADSAGNVSESGQSAADQSAAAFTQGTDPIPHIEPQTSVVPGALPGQPANSNMWGINPGQANLGQ